MKPHNKSQISCKGPFLKLSLNKIIPIEFWQPLTCIGTGPSLKLHMVHLHKKMSYCWQYHIVAILYEQKTVPASYADRKWWVILNNLLLSIVLSYCCCAIVRLDVCVFLALKNSECLAQLTNSSLHVSKGMLGNPQMIFLCNFIPLMPSDTQFCF